MGKLYCGLLVWQFVINTLLICKWPVCLLLDCHLKEMLAWLYVLIYRVLLYVAGLVSGERTILLCSDRWRRPVCCVVCVLNNFHFIFAPTKWEPALQFWCSTWAGWFRLWIPAWTRHFSVRPYRHCGPPNFLFSEHRSSSPGVGRPERDR
jgi:hypothetical protein